MKTHALRMAKLILGWFFLILGVIGLFLPVLQGVLFIVIGLAILAPEQEWAHRLLLWLRRRFPHLATVFDQGRLRAERWLRRFTHRGKRSP